jgi:hypothetical protein
MQSLFYVPLPRIYIPQPLVLAAYTFLRFAVVDNASIGLLFIALLASSNSLDGL